MGAGWYQAYHPENMDQRTAEDLADEIVRDITVGVNDSSIRSGIIGEVGINGDPLTRNEIKSLQASARASRATSAAISLHRGGVGTEKLLQTIAILEEEGGGRLIPSHLRGGDYPSSFRNEASRVSLKAPQPVSLIILRRSLPTWSESPLSSAAAISGSSR